MEPEITVNGERRALGARTLGELLREIGRDPARPGIAVAVNGRVIVRRDWEGHELRPGDAVEIVGAVQGG